MFRDRDGKPTNHQGLRLRLSDFAHEGLVKDEIGNQDKDLTVSAQQLCLFLSAAEARVDPRGLLSKDPIAPGIKKRKRSETPEDRIASGDEAWYAEQEERTTKRIAGDDPDYEDRMKSSSE